MAAPLALETVLEMAFWTRDCSNPETIVDDNVNNTLRELSLHSKEVFEEWAPKVISAYHDLCGKAPKITTRLALLRTVEGLTEWC
jgi:hypothetical protein